VFSNRNILLSISILGLITLLSCSKDGLPTVAKNTDLEAELTKVPEGFDAISFPDDNPFSLAKWTLGKKLFFDPALSIDYSKSCASCHGPEIAFSDNQPTSKGVEGRMELETLHHLQMLPSILIILEKEVFLL
jgi:cytochrome c peroxidase